MCLIDRSWACLCPAWDKLVFRHYFHPFTELCYFQYSAFFGRFTHLFFEAKHGLNIYHISSLTLLSWALYWSRAYLQALCKSPWNALLDLSLVVAVSKSGTADVRRLIKLLEVCKETCVQMERERHMYIYQTCKPFIKMSLNVKSIRKKVKKLIYATTSQKIF